MKAARQVGAVLLFSLAGAIACGSGPPVNQCYADGDCASGHSCSGGACVAGATTAHVASALAGTPDSSTEAAANVLWPVLDPADWFYLANAVWPADAATVLADPRLQKAMKPLMGTSLGTASSPFALHLDGNPPQSPTSGISSQDLLDQLRALLQQTNGQALARLYTVVAAFAQALAQSILTLPTAGRPADLTADSVTTNFYDNGQSVTVNTGTPPCCVGSLVFPGGVFTCLDATSCKGKGEPSKPAPDAGAATSPCAGTYTLTFQKSSCTIKGTQNGSLTGTFTLVVSDQGVVHDPTGMSTNWEGSVGGSCVFKSCSNAEYTLTFGSSSSCSTFFNSALGVCDEICPMPCSLTRN